MPKLIPPAAGDIFPHPHRHIPKRVFAPKAKTRIEGYRARLGYRVIMDIGESMSDITLYSSSLRDITSLFPSLIERLKQVPVRSFKNTRFLCRLVYVDHPQTNALEKYGQESISALRSIWNSHRPTRSTHLRLVIEDVVVQGGRFKLNTSFCDRKHSLDVFVDHEVSLRSVCIAREWIGNVSALNLIDTATLKGWSGVDIVHTHGTGYVRAKANLGQERPRPSWWRVWTPYSPYYTCRDKDLADWLQTQSRDPNLKYL